jgi:hypothetical protein
MPSSLYEKKGLECLRLMQLVKIIKKEACFKKGIMGSNKMLDKWKNVASRFWNFA